TIIDTTGPVPNPPYEAGFNKGSATLVAHDKNGDKSALLPLVIRTGGRYIWYSGDQEKADVELDVVYERWSSVGSLGVLIEHTLPTPLKNPIEIPHNYDDTVGFRLGGSYNFDRLSVRG